MLPHELVGGVKLTLVVAWRSRGLMVHDHLHAFLLCVSFDAFHIEIRVWGHEIEHVFLHVSVPVLPSNVPAFHKHAVESVFGGEVDVSLDIGRVRSMLSVRLHLCQVIGRKVYAAEVISVGPRTLAGDHLPPDTDILARMDPRCVLDLARLVEI